MALECSRNGEYAGRPADTRGPHRDEPRHETIFNALPGEAAVDKSGTGFENPGTTLSTPPNNIPSKKDSFKEL